MNFMRYANTKIQIRVYQARRPDATGCHWSVGTLAIRIPCLSSVRVTVSTLGPSICGQVSRHYTNAT